MEDNQKMQAGDPVENNPTQPKKPADSQAAPQPNPQSNPAEKPKTLSKNISLKLSADVYDLLQNQAKTYSISPAMFVTVLLKRNAAGADKKEVENTISAAKDYMLCG